MDDLIAAIRADIERYRAEAERVRRSSPGNPAAYAALSRAVFELAEALYHLED